MVNLNDFLLDNNSDEDQVLDDITGTITSPNYPFNYDNNMDLEWTLTAPSNKVIKIQFEAFDVQYSSQTVMCFEVQMYKSLLSFS